MPDYTLNLTNESAALLSEKISTPNLLKDKRAVTILGQFNEEHFYDLPIPVFKQSEINEYRAWQRTKLASIVVSQAVRDAFVKLFDACWEAGQISGHPAWMQVRRDLGHLE